MSSGDWLKAIARDSARNLLDRLAVAAQPRRKGRSSAADGYQIEGLERRLFLSSGITAFQAQQTFLTGTSPFSVTVADVNGDGKSDLLAVNFGSATLSVLLGNGNGTFQAQRTFATGTSPYSVVAADVNGDGKADVVVANSASNTVSVLLGNGDGTFQAQQTFATSAHPFTVAVADMNGDTRPDIVVANSGSNGNNVGMLLGNGNGTFQAQQPFTVGTKPVAVVVADANGDGKPDLVVSNSNSNNVSVLLSNGFGAGFQAQKTFAAGSTLYSLAVADVNGDGSLDLVVANETSNTVSVLLGNGNGTFQSPQSFATGANPDSVAVADVNRDGKADLIVTNFNGSNVSVLMGNGNGTFQAQQVYATGSHPNSVAVADVNADGRPDLVIANEGGNTVSVLLADTPPVVLSINRATPPGPFTSDSSVNYAVTFNEPVTGVDPTDFALALNGAAATTPVVVSGSGAVYTVTVNGISGAGTLGLNLIDNGSIKDLAGNPLQAGATVSFQTQQTFATGQSPASVVTADVNGDGKPDLVVANETSSTVGVLLGNGNGTFHSQQTFTTGPDPTSVVTADMNGDGRVDLVVANANNNTISILLGNGNGTFQGQQIFSAAAGSYAFSVAVADFNGDGHPDLVVGNGAFKTTVSVLLSNGGGAFLAPRTFTTGSYPRAVAVADVNGDGRPDLVVANHDSNSVSVLLGNGNGTFLAQQTFAAGSIPLSVAASDINGDGKPDLVLTNWNSNNVSVLLGNGNGTFQAQRTFATGPQPFFVVVSDVNGDGRPDLIVPNQNTSGNAGSLSVLLGNGDGTFQVQQTFAAGKFPVSVAASDVNGDGRPDLIATNAGSYTVGVFLGNANGNFTGQIYTTVPSLDTINGTSGVDDITLTEDPDHTHIDWTGPGGPAQMLINDPNGLTINSNGSVDNIALSYGNGYPLPDLLKLNGTFLFNTGLTLGSSTISGGTLDFNSGQKLVVSNTANDGAILNGVTINGDMDLTTQSLGALVSITNGLTLNGTATLGFDHGDGVYWLGSIWFDGTQTFSGNATVLFQGRNNGTSLYVPNGPDTQHVATLTLGPNVLVHGLQGYVGYDPYFASGGGGANGGPVNARSIVNNGTIDADVAGGNIYVSAVNWINAVANGFEFGGTLKAENGGTLNLGAEALGGTQDSGGAFTNTGTITAIGAGSIVNITVATYNDQGTVQGISGGVVNVSGATTLSFTGGNATVTGTVSATNVSINGADVSFVGTTPISIQNLSLFGGGTLDGSAAVTITSTASLGTATMAGIGTTFIASGAVATVNGNFTSSRVFQNAGTVNLLTGSFELDGGGTQTGSFNVAQGTNLLVGGTTNQNFAGSSSVTGNGTTQFVQSAIALVQGTYNVGFTEAQQQSQTTFAGNASTTSFLLSGGKVLVGGSAQGGARPALAPATTSSTTLMAGTAVCAGGEFDVLAGGTIQTTTLNFLGGTNDINIASDNTSPGTLALAGDVTLSTGTAVIQSTGSATKAGLVDLGGAQRSFTVNGASTQVELSISAQVTDGSLTSAGPGRLQLTNAGNNFTGSIVAGGVLEADAAGSLGSAPVTFQGGTLSSGGNSLVLSNQLTAAPNDSISVDVGAATVQVPGVNLGVALNVTGSGTLIVAGPVTLQANANIHNAANLTITGVVSGGFGFTKDMAGTMTLQGPTANTYTGATSVNLGTLLLNKPSNLRAVPGGLTINGPATVQLSAPGEIAPTATLGLNSVPGLAVFNLNGQTQSLAAINDTGGGSLLIGGGTLTITGTVTNNSGTLVIGAGGARAVGQLTFGGLNLVGGGKLDLANNSLLVNYAGQSDPIATIRAYLASGFNNGAWNGAGIVSGNAATNARQTTAIGFADSVDGLISGQPANTIELKYTLYGDTTLTGTVGPNDLTRLRQHYNQTTGGTWDTGDFNYDGSVNFNDFTLLTRNYNTTLGSQAAPAVQAAATTDHFLPKHHKRRDSGRQ